MSKTNKFLALALGLVTMLFVNSCVEDDDYTVPEVLVPAVNPADFGTKTTFSAVVARHNDAVDVDGNGDISDEEGDNADNIVGVFSTEFDAPLYIEGYVVSSDAAGNFFEEIIIQNSTDENDAAGDERRGFKVEINVRDLANFYNYGRKVYVRLNGLAIGISNGVYTLGKANGESLQQLEPYEYKDFVIRDPEVATITPKTLAIGDLEEKDENTLVRFENSQIIKADMNSTYAGELTDEFDGFRVIESCADNGQISLQTSTFADFKSQPVAQGVGSITGIYSRDFGDDFDVLIVNDTDAINFTNPDRCDPLVLECDGTSGGGNTIFSEDFQTFSNYAAEGWTMINVNGGNVDWFISGFQGNDYSRISAFNSNETNAEVWLVTPGIDMDTTTGEELSFDVQANFDNGTILTVFASNDFTGDVTTATWFQVEVDIPTGPSGTFGSFETVGPANVSCLDGTVNFAFVYKGSDPGATTRYHVDNVEVTGN